MIGYDNIVLIRAVIQMSFCSLLKFYSKAREIRSRSTGSVSFPQVSVPVGCQIPFSKLIYCTCVFPALYLHSLAFFVCLLESLYLARLLNAERSASKARASGLSRSSLGYRGTADRRLHAYTLKHALSKSHITSDGQMVELENKHNKVNRKLPAS